MNTALSRLNAVFAFSLSVLACLTFLCFLSTAFVDKSSTPSISVHPQVVLYVTVRQEDCVYTGILSCPGEVHMTLGKT